MEPEIMSNHLDVEYAMSERGQRIVIFERHKFQLKYISKDAEETWRCSNRKCMAKLYLQQAKINLEKSSPEHNHDTDVNKINRQVVNNYCKRKAMEEKNERPSKIIKQIVSNTERDLSSSDLELIRKNIHNARKSTLPKLQQSLLDTQQILKDLISVREEMDSLPGSSGVNNSNKLSSDIFQTDPLTILQVLLSEKESSESDIDLSDEDQYDHHGFFSSNEENGNDSPSNHSLEFVNLPQIWSDESSSMKSIPFIGTPGLKIKPEEDSPKNYFNMLFDDSLFDLVINQTNKNVKMMFESGLKKNSRIAKWNDLTTVEFKQFLGLLFHMGVIKINRLEDYWKTDYLFKIPIFKEMSRNRFMSILRALHFAADLKSITENKDKLKKIRPLIDYFNKKMVEIYSPERELCIDESLVLWGDRLNIRQFIKNKRQTYDLKVYILTEIDGTVLKFWIYTNTSDIKNHVEHVVWNLLDDKFGLGHSIYMDSHYNSVELAQKLLQKDTYLTGPLNEKKKQNPFALYKTKLQKGEVMAKYNEGVCVFKWRDRNEILMLSTEFTHKLITVKDKKKQEIQKPKAFVEYNKHINGIEQMDQLLSYCLCERKTIEWHKKIGIHIFLILLQNSYLLYNKYAERKVNYHDFILDIIKYLIGVETQSPVEPKRVKLLDHMPQKKETLTKDGRTVRLRCRVCSKFNKHKKTSYYCPKCPENPGLCPAPCFQIYHKDMC